MGLITTFLDLDNYVGQAPGREKAGRAIDRLRVDPTEGFLGYLPANPLAKARSWVPLGSQFEGDSYLLADETQTLASGSIAMAAGGLLITTAASSTAVVTKGTRTYTPAAGQYWKAVTRLQSTTAATCGVLFGFDLASSTTPFTDDTDMVVIRCPNNSAALTGRVRGNSGTAADNTTWVTSETPGAALAAVSLANTTDMELGVEFYLGSTLATCWGAFWVNGYRTPFTAAQLVQLFAILTTPPAMTRFLSIQGDGTGRTATVQFMLGGCSR